MNKKHLALALAATTAGLLAASPSTAVAGKAKKGAVKCYNVHDCGGKSACGGNGNASCSGKNDCGGKGYIKIVTGKADYSNELCKKLGGTLTPKKG